MDVLHEIHRSNGRSVALLQHEGTQVGRERDLFYVRGVNRGNPGEVVSVYLTADEVDRLTACRHDPLAEQRAQVDTIFSTLRSLSFLHRRR